MPSQHKARIRYGTVAPNAYEALRAMQGYVDGTSLPRSLLELVKIRSSQINGCAYCLDMHTKDARLLGESEQRIYLLPAWREAPFYSDREKAALEWAEALTLVSKGQVSDDIYERAREQFSEKELVELTMAIIAINSWNRMSIAFRHPVPGTYQPKRLEETH